MDQQYKAPSDRETLKFRDTPYSLGGGLPPLPAHLTLGPFHLLLSS